MKTFFLSTGFLLVAAILFFLAHTGDSAAITCSTVAAKAASCVGFATGKDKKPTADCCSGLEQLAQSVGSVEDKKTICRCLKSSAKNLGVQDKFLSQIPAACRIKVGFPVSANTNCETIR